MEGAEAQPPDPEGCLWVPPGKANSGVEEDPREEAWEVLAVPGPPAPGDPPPAKVTNSASVYHTASFGESGSRVISDVDGMSRDNILQYLRSKFSAVTRFKDPAAREFLKLRLQEAKDKLRLLELQAQESQEVARLKAELQEAKRSQRTGNLSITFPWSKTDFHIQVLVTGRTGNCEKLFLKKVSDRLSDLHINLKSEKYREDSRHSLMVFCPVSSRVGTDMQNALEDLKGEPKAVLVMLHHKPKESTSFVDTKLQAAHPAVVCTVHARYTIQEGFYTCAVNEEAVDTVANVLEQCYKAGKGDHAIPSAPSKSWNR